MLRAISQLSGSKWEPIAEDATIEEVEALKLNHRGAEAATIVDGEITKLNMNYWNEIAGA